MKTVKLILGDQLNAGHSWYRQVDPDAVFVIAELAQETRYVTHHIQKILAFFGAMRRFADALAAAGHEVRYFTLDDTAGYRDLTDFLVEVIAREGATALHYQLPDEYRLDQQLQALQDHLAVPVRAVDTEHFLTPRDAWDTYPTSRMEFFYRALRKQYKVLMTGSGEPEGGRWNFDAENRNKLPKSVDIPEPLTFGHDLSDIAERIQRHAVPTLGHCDPANLIWPLSREEGRHLLQYFLEHCLPDFGRYQDALSDRGWSLFHSRLSFCLNTKMLHPGEVVTLAEAKWRKNPDRISLAQVEGFIRQILGWREFVRALYWKHMPEYSGRNFFAADTELPAYYWTGETDMACMAHSIGQSLEHAYAHHIQRLMVTGNFALLAGIDPDAVDAWYLGIYIDAIEWVELPNTRGMSQFADGGLIASKPYAASGQYINRMGDHCKRCRYDVKQKTGPNSCPFNSLYWSFLHRNREQLQDNHRLKLVYANWDKQPNDQKAAILATAKHRLAGLDTL